jgi:MFS family permease
MVVEQQERVVAVGVEDTARDRESWVLLGPLRSRPFATLWAAVAASFTAQWMLSLSAQWFLVQQPGAASLVPVVQVVLMLPMAVLAVPAGVLADNFDRRRLIIIVQSAVLVLELALVALAFTDSLTPLALLTLLALLACGMILSFTPFQSMVPDLVERDAIPAAAALVAIATNSARIVGPALGGILIALTSVSASFASPVPLTLFLLVAVLTWRGHSAPPVQRERFGPAMRSGFRFVIHSPQAVTIMARGLWFTAGIVALLALLPLLAARLGADSTELGLLFAMQGAGAVAGALSLPALQRHYTPNRIIGVGFLVGAVALLISATAPNLLVASAAPLVSGWSWTVALATLQACIQIYLPAWVRARGVAMLLMSVYAGQAIGATVLGWLAVHWSLRGTLAVAGLFLAAAVPLASRWPVKDFSGTDRSSVRGRPRPEVDLQPAELHRLLEVRIAYSVPPEHDVDFREVMRMLRRVRLRTGARRWQLLKDASSPGLFVEEFIVSSWQDYMVQRRDRAIASDLALEARAKALSVVPPTARYFVSVDLDALPAQLALEKQ